ncbi:DNA-binding cell septation regulator SpoVG [Lachnospiraceae bacterium PM6-15]|uniref:septation protein SpoVG family protein n=1 Tax=Ohessyouella blattaphilus TaxID=2949333 RepID=UPI003E31C23C
MSYEIKAEMKVSDRENEVAYGTVIVDNCIKFSVQVRETKEGKWFVSFPRKQGSNGDYEDVVYPSDKQLREDIDTAVFYALKREMTKEVFLPEIEKVRVTALERSDSKTKALATITVTGLTIKGLVVREGEKGLFVAMPQFKTGEEYRDVAYGTTKNMKEKISEAVLKEYDKTLNQKKEKKKDNGAR